MRFPRPAIRVYPAALLLFLAVSGALVQAWVMRPLAAVGDAVLYLSFVSGAVGLWLVIPVVQVVVAMGSADLRSSRSTGRVAWTALRAALLMALFLLFKTLFARALRQLSSLVFAVDFPALPLMAELRAEFPKDVLHFALLVAIWAFLETRRQRNEGARRAAELQAGFAQARFDALGARLDAHFLFNALNTVGSLMHEDLARAERLLHSLAQLLRTALAEDRATWSFAEEQAHTRRYLDFVEARFGDRVSVSWQLAPELDGLQVPRFGLQSLVENSVKHNETLRGSLCIHVSGERLADEAVLAVRDNGVGFGDANQDEQRATRHIGSGLRRLDELARLLHGADARLTQRDLPEGGAEVRLSWPWPKSS